MKRSKNHEIRLQIQHVICTIGLCSCRLVFIFIFEQQLQQQPHTKHFRMPKNCDPTITLTHIRNALATSTGRLLWWCRHICFHFSLQHRNIMLDLSERTLSVPWFDIHTATAFTVIQHTGRDTVECISCTLPIFIPSFAAFRCSVIHLHWLYAVCTGYELEKIIVSRTLHSGVMPCRSLISCSCA